MTTESHVYLFDARFAAAVASGRKMQTIRSLRRVPPAPGDRLELFQADTPNGAPKGLQTVTCASVQPIKMFRSGSYTRVQLASELLILVQIRDLALADGFDSTVDFLRYFERRYGLPFEGVLIKWEVPNGSASA